MSERPTLGVWTLGLTLPAVVAGAYLGGVAGGAAGIVAVLFAGLMLVLNFHTAVVCDVRQGVYYLSTTLLILAFVLFGLLYLNFESLGPINRLIGALAGGLGMGTGMPGIVRRAHRWFHPPAEPAAAGPAAPPAWRRRLLVAVVLAACGVGLWQVFLVRIIAIGVLAPLGAPAVPILAHGLADRDRDVRVAAVPALQSAQQASDSRVSAAAWLALRAIGPAPSSRSGLPDLPPRPPYRKP